VAGCTATTKHHPAGQILLACNVVPLHCPGSCCYYTSTLCGVRFLATYTRISPRPPCMTFPRFAKFASSFATLLLSSLNPFSISCFRSSSRSKSGKPKTFVASASKSLSLVTLAQHGPCLATLPPCHRPIRYNNRPRKQLRQWASQS
jgi:hypothetical protein